jgi:hypothetical protein
MICMKLRPKACLECVAGDMTGLMCQFLGLGGVVILYGLLSEKPAGGIDTINFLARGLKIESYLLTDELAKMTLSQYFEFILRAEPLYRS